MNSPGKSSRFGQDDLQNQIFLLLRRIQQNSQLVEEDLGTIVEWFNEFSKTPLCHGLLKNKCLDKNAFLYQEPFDLNYSFGKSLFNEASVFFAVQEKLELASRAFSHNLSHNMTVGLFPPLYTRRLKKLLQQDGVLVIELYSPSDLFACEGDFDLVIHSPFLYGEREGACYASLFRSLKPGGYLITDTWSDLKGKSCCHDREKEKWFFEDLFEMKQMAFLSAEELKITLSQVGFVRMQCLPRQEGRITTLVAQKPEIIASRPSIARAIAHTPRKMQRKGVLIV